MEGTPHERAIIVLLAYAIGFITAYIAFALGHVEKTQTIALVAYYYDTDNSTSTDVLTEHEVTQGVSVSYSDGRLVRSDGENTRLISIAAANGFAETVAEPGVHTQLVSHNSTTDADFIFFCEDDYKEENCFAYVYDAKKNMIHSITVNGEQLVLTDTDATAATWDSYRLEVNTLASVDETEPWVLQ